MSDDLHRLVEAGGAEDAHLGPDEPHELFGETYPHHRAVSLQLEPHQDHAGQPGVEPSGSDSEARCLLSSLTVSLDATGDLAGTPLKVLTAGRLSEGLDGPPGLQVVGEVACVEVLVLTGPTFPVASDVLDAAAAAGPARESG